MDTNFEEYLINNKDWKWNFERVFIKPNIPEKKLYNSLTYATKVSPNEVLMLVDDTVFGGAKEGFILTSDAIYFHEFMGDPKKVELGKIREIQIIKKQIKINGAIYFESTLVEPPILTAIANRIQKTLDQLHTTSTTESENELSIIEPKVAIQSIEEKTKPIPNSDINSRLKKIQRDEYYSIIEKLKNINKASAVAQFVLGDFNKERPIKKITENFTNTIHKSVLIFRNDIINKLCLYNLSNDISTVEIGSYVTAKTLSKLLRYKLPEPVLAAIMEDALPDTFFIKTNDDGEILLDIIDEYMQGEEPHMLFLTRLFVTNQEMKFLTSIKPYVFHILDEYSDGLNHDFEAFIQLLEKDLISFNSKTTSLIQEFTSSTLDILHSK